MIRRSSARWPVVAVAAVSLFVLPPMFARADNAAPANNAAANEAAKPLAFPAGFVAETNTTPSPGINNALAKLADSALTKGDFKILLSQLELANGVPVTEPTGVDQAKLDAQIDRIRSAWKDKYQKEWVIDANAAYGAPIEIAEGRVDYPSSAVHNWPVPAGPGEAMTASASFPQSNPKEIKQQENALPLQKGENVALVRFPGVHGHPALTASLVQPVKEGNWFFDLPENRTSAEIYNDTLMQLTWLADHSAHWPTDSNAAARAVTRHILAAVYGVNLMPPAKG